MAVLTSAFAKAAGERMVRAIAASEIVIWTADGADVVGGVDLQAIGWAAVVAGIVSLCLSVLGDTVGKGPGPSLIGAEAPTGKP